MSTVPFRKYYQYSNHKIKALYCCSVQPKLNSHLLQEVFLDHTGLSIASCSGLPEFPVEAGIRESSTESLLHHVFHTPNHELHKIRASLHFSISPKRFPPHPSENSSYPKNKK